MTTTDTAEVDALRARVAELESEREISRLMVRYAESLDYGDNVGWANTFTPDGFFDVHKRGERLFSHTGTDALVAFAGQHTHAPQVYHKHFLSVPTIEFDGDDRASAKTYFTMLYDREAGPFVLVFGRYFDELVRTGDGWRLSSRIVDMESLPPTPAAA